jgi:hypothetical protein
MTLTNAAALELTDWRRRVTELYAAVRADHDPERAHAVWRSRRDALFRTHPQSPLPPGDPLRTTGLPYRDYDPAMGFELPLLPAPGPQQRPVPTGADQTTTLRLIGQVTFPAPRHRRRAVAAAGRRRGCSCRRVTAPLGTPATAQDAAPSTPPTAPTSAAPPAR